MPDLPIPSIPQRSRGVTNCKDGFRDCHCLGEAPVVQNVQQYPEGVFNHFGISDKTANYKPSRLRKPNYKGPFLRLGSRPYHFFQCRDSLPPFLTFSSFCVAMRQRLPLLLPLPLAVWQGADCVKIPLLPQKVCLRKHKNSFFHSFYEFCFGSGIKSKLSFGSVHRTKPLLSAWGGCNS